jgi:FkbM family methyltransferase
MVTYHSQIHQDYLLDTVVFRGLRNGVFVEVGANDGVSLSNTLTFERDRGWRGLCIEPNPTVFAALEAARQVPCINLGVGDRDALLPFQVIHGAGQMLSGFVNMPGKKLQRRIDRELILYGSQTEIINVPCRPLDDILDENGIGEIHYLSIDTQGEEPQILRSLNPSRMIHVITVECNYASDLPGLLASSRHNFVLAAKHRHDLFLIHRDKPLPLAPDGAVVGCI